MGSEVQGSLVSLPTSKVNWSPGVRAGLGAGGGRGGRPHSLRVSSPCCVTPGTRFTSLSLGFLICIMGRPLGSVQ